MIGVLAMVVPGAERGPSPERRRILEGMRETDRLRQVAQEANERLVRELAELNERFRLVRRTTIVVEEFDRREDRDVHP